MVGGMTVTDRAAVLLISFSSLPAVPAVIFFYLSNEGVSLLENAAYLGLPIPQKLKSVLEQLHDRAEKEDK
jgi:phage-related holin